MKLLKVKKSGEVLGNEKGFALILTMSMLTVLSITGVMVLNTTDTELKITSNARANSEAFVAAELAVEYAQNKVILDPGSIAAGTNYDLIDDDNDIADLLPDGMELEVNGRNEIDFYTGLPPAGMSNQTSTDAYISNIYRTSNSTDTGDGGDAAYYRVSVEARARDRAAARVETLFVNRGGQVF
ncbi:hypothetical protein SAMN02745165_00226 [Malonomonas rubra DSM 5091]|uniref:Type 4 fimbrial biogenesis protein PilX N-terminal domain-containing protein n=1 Tax=Malonomonas rubra DSM 5091 TaxID=1122189 RepID=A0A1M6BM10_MALRU|nr:PilX N-terminal domain-containing pilus assembly protein [Malonomonas rubra]SHI49543.1 hypothetical protein SAMN02745165_00226 [Malonomonas rubra DSM 5091]